MSIHIQIERFEGPLGLLLHLIRREEMDIFDINIHAITKQYLDYIKAMKKLDLEVAGEFVAMAATLIHIKSRMLLPNYNEDGEEVESEDPRKELVQKLLDYQMYQDASQRLYERPLVGRDVWLRGTRLKIESDQEEEIIVEDNALFSLITAYRAVVRDVKKKIHKVGQSLQSIAERILEIKERLVVGETSRFSELVEKKHEDPELQTNQVLITFLSLLELGKMGFVSLFQSKNFDDIYIETKKVIDRDVIARAESFEAHHSDEESEFEVAMREETVAEELMAEPPQPVSEVDEVLSEEPVEEPETSYKFEVKLDRLEFEGEAEAAGESTVEAATDEEIEQEESRLAQMDQQQPEQTMATEDAVELVSDERPVEGGV